jgi:Ner family transcriptional regulator
MHEEINPKERIVKNSLLRSRRNHIIYLLQGRGYTVSSLAKNIGVSPQAVTNAMRAPYPRIEKKIAEILGEAVEKLFPERYNDSGGSSRRPGPFSKIPQTPKNKKD